MDDFITYIDEFDQALDNIDKVLTRCQDTNLSLSNEKCKMVMTEGIVLSHDISDKGIKVDPAKLHLNPKRM